ncbi:hypothetical protein IAT38_002722 [Cryptococcus sp. DSM 104549]
MSPPATSKSTDFWSPAYWASRFEGEQQFEWLVPSEVVVALVADCLASAFVGDDQEVRILHIGCGSSNLGAKLQGALDVEPPVEGRRYQVHDTDYVLPPALAGIVANEDEGVVDCGRGREEGVPFHLIDVLSLSSLLSSLPTTSPPGPSTARPQWHFILDKSTSDAISTGPPLPPSSPSSLVSSSTSSPAFDLPTDPVERLAHNLAQVTPPGARWLSISYSPSRYPFLPSSTAATGEQAGIGWHVLKREMIATTSLPGGRRVREANGEERVVYEPETGVWAYLLERV